MTVSLDEQPFDVLLAVIQSLLTDPNFAEMVTDQICVELDRAGYTIQPKRQLGEED